MVEREIEVARSFPIGQLLLRNHLVGQNPPSKMIASLSILGNFGRVGDDFCLC